MTNARTFSFPPFHLDIATKQLWRGSKTIPLRPKAFAVLRYLMEHAGQVVSRAALVAAVWGTTKVSEPVLRGCLREIRQALRDSVETPQFIETVGRQGWRFIAKVVSTQSSVVSPQPSAPPRSQLGTDNWQLTTPLVGRETELTQLHQWLDKATTGQRQLVFISGEPGIGKTTLVDAFLFGVRSHEEFGVHSPKPRTLNSELPSTPSPWIGRGQCIEHYGPGEAYLPVLEALDRLCQQPGHERLLTLLRQHAPMWLAQLPTLLTADERVSLQREIAGCTRERMLRELAVLLEALTADTTLVLVLEDLHWSDLSTLDLLALIARRSEPARLLVVGTYRSSEVHTHNHPLSAMLQELQYHSLCSELLVEGLSEAAVAQYLERRFPVRAFPTRFAHVLHQRTEGNPLFLVNLVEDFIQQGVLTDGEGGWTFQGTLDALAHYVPASSRQLITKLLGQVGRTIRRVLAAGSVAGLLFSSAAVAAALDTTASEVESHCEEAVRRRLFIERAGKAVWPDGTEAARYGFRHALYQQLWHEQVSVSQQQEWHQRIGLRKEAAYKGRVQEIAAELAMHFAQARDYQRAIQYHEQAATNARCRHAYQEAIQHLTSGLSLLTSLPDSPVRDQQELSLRMALGASAIATQGFAAPEVAIIFDRARTLCETLHTTALLPSTLQGLWVFHFVRGELRTALALGKTLLQLAQHEQDSVSLVQAHISLGAPFLFLGELENASQHMGQGITLSTPQPQQGSAQVYELDPGMFCRSYGGFARLCLGYADQGKALCEEAVQLATTIKHPHSLALALTWAFFARYFCGEYEAARERAEMLLALAREHVFPYWLGFGLMTHGWTLGLVERWPEAREEISQGIVALRQTGTGLAIRSGTMLFADVYRREGQNEAGRQLLAEFSDAGDDHGEQLWDVELHRLRGELTLQKEFKVQGSKFHVPNTQHPTPSPQAEAEACFLKAIDIARKQHAKLLELRVTLSLARLWQQQGKKHEAHQMLSNVYGWFTEGFDTKDLQEAKALVESLESRV